METGIRLGDQPSREAGPCPEPRREGVQLGVPLYTYPTDANPHWEMAARSAERIRFVVVNVANGPGEQVDPAYEGAIGTLNAAEVQTIGYVDTDYGDRPLEDVLVDVRTWSVRYGVRGVFIDQVAGDFAHLDYYARVALGARGNGAQFVVFNPGTDCHPALADIANVIVSFEGTWTDYQKYEPSLWMFSFPPTRFCHLVHATPQSQIARGPQRAAENHATTSFFSDGEGGNPWDRFPATLVVAVPPPVRNAKSPRSQPASELWRQRRVVATPGLPTTDSRGARTVARRATHRSIWNRMLGRHGGVMEVFDVMPGIQMLSATIPSWLRGAGQVASGESTPGLSTEALSASPTTVGGSSHDLPPTIRVTLMSEPVLVRDP